MWKIWVKGYEEAEKHLRAFPRTRAKNCFVKSKNIKD